MRGSLVAAFVAVSPALLATVWARAIVLKLFCLRHNFSAHVPGTRHGESGRQAIRSDLPDPRLWWTWDYGNPDPYTLSVRLGTNYYYGHLFPSEMTRASYARDLNLMLGRNVNMIRLHCHFANPEVCALPSERGVWIRQDYLEP